MTTSLLRTSLGELIYTSLAATSLGELGGGAITPSTIPFSGGKRRVQPRLANVIKFKGLTEVFEVEEEPIEISDTSFGLSQEITRFEHAADTLKGQLELAESEILVFKARESLEAQLRAEFLIEDTIRAGRFIQELILQIIELRLLRRRREEEEIIILLIMDD